MAPEKQETSTDYKWLEYTLYAAALAFVLIAVYQLTKTHRIVLLERENYTSTATNGGATAEVEATADDQGA